MTQRLSSDSTVSQGVYSAPPYCLGFLKAWWLKVVGFPIGIPGLQEQIFHWKRWDCDAFYIPRLRKHSITFAAFYSLKQSQSFRFKGRGLTSLQEKCQWNCGHNKSCHTPPGNSNVQPKLRRAGSISCKYWSTEQGWDLGEANEIPRVQRQSLSGSCKCRVTPPYILCPRPFIGLTLVLPLLQSTSVWIMGERRT